MGIGIIIEQLQKIGVEVDEGYPITIEALQGLIDAFSELGTEDFRTVVEASQTTKEGRAGYFYFVQALNHWNRSGPPRQRTLRAVGGRGKTV